MSYVYITLGVLIITSIIYGICSLMKLAKPANAFALALGAGLITGGALHYHGP